MTDCLEHGSHEKLVFVQGYVHNYNCFVHTESHSTCGLAEVIFLSHVGGININKHNYLFFFAPPYFMGRLRVGVYDNLSISVICTLCRTCGWKHESKLFASRKMNQVRLSHIGHVWNHESALLEQANTQCLVRCAIFSRHFQQISLAAATLGFTSLFHDSSTLW